MLTQDILLKDFSKPKNGAYFSKNYESIIDSNGNEVNYDDPRVVYIYPLPINIYAKKLIVGLFRKNNRNVRIGDEIDSSIIKYGKQLCSGKECLPTLAIAGSVMKDLNEYRQKNEISIYVGSMSGYGTCQHAAWPLLWESFSNRLNYENALYNVFITKENNWVGLSDQIEVMPYLYWLIGDYICETRNSIYCCASDLNSALEKFDELTDDLISQVITEKYKLKTALKLWAQKISMIPLKQNVQNAPKVIIFSGLNLFFNKIQITQSFLEHGINPKIADFLDGITWAVSGKAAEFSLNRGYTDPENQFSIINLLKESFYDRFSNNSKDAIKSRINMFLVEMMINQYKKIIDSSQLTVQKGIMPLIKMLKYGHPYASFNAYSESTMATGRFLQSLNEKIFDGYVCFGSFTCQPAMNTQTIVLPIANQNDVPFLAMDCETIELTNNHLKQIEVLSVQIKRKNQLRKLKN
jgi:predicted nucleotide-binding protein (sugar kinase/HSP70/actin superfamily)